MTRRYWTVTELALEWHVSKAQVRKWIDAQVLPAVRVAGWMIRVRAPDAARFEAENFTPLAPKARTPSDTHSPSTPPRV